MRTLESGAICPTPEKDAAIAKAALQDEGTVRITHFQALDTIEPESAFGPGWHARKGVPSFMPIVC